MDNSGVRGASSEPGGGEGSPSGPREDQPGSVGGSSGGGESSSLAVATTTTTTTTTTVAAAAATGAPPSRYESQKRRDWNTFLQYLRNHKPPLSLSRCSGAHVIEFLKYLDQFGKTKVHISGCPYFGHPNPPAPCACPLKQAWGSLDALIGRLRAAFEENGGRPESNPFGARAVRIYLREVRESQAKARGIPYEKKKRKRVSASSSSSAATTPQVGSSGTHESGSGSGEATTTTTIAGAGVGPPATTTT